MSSPAERRAGGRRRSRTGGLRRAAVIIGAAIVLAGVIGLAYPSIGSYINRLAQGRAVREYRRQSEHLAESGESEILLDQARQYNRWVFSRGGGIKDLDEQEMERYNDVLAMSVTGIMGYLEIPSIDVSLPIYHGTEEAVLQVGVGHLAGSSLPVGGENTHAVLTGHSGLPSSRLFTDLDQLQTGDTFTITVLDHTAAYVVDDIQVVTPEEAELVIEDGTDRCTLVTCVPIGVNTHRLLVRGSRTEPAQPSPSPVPSAPREEEQSRAEQLMPYIMICAVTALAAIIGICIIVRHDRKG